MTDRPIIFSAPMVRALLDDSKTQTRRLATSPLRACVPADRLWVRETFYLFRGFDRMTPNEVAGRGSGCAYAATEQDGQGLGKLRPSIHMPRWASRLTLTVDAVRVQRLQEIDQNDARAEGFPNAIGGGDSTLPFYKAGTGGDCTGWFAGLWEHLHGVGSWDANPEVLALTFRVTQGNIDTP